MATRTLSADALTYRIPSMIEKFEAVAKRAKRLGKGSIVWTLGETFTRQERMPFADKPVDRLLRKVEVTFEVPVIGGWEVLGVLLRPAMDGRAVFQGWDDVTIPTAWLDRDVCGVCDHCGTKRRRNFTVILANDAGELKKVGSACLKDFTGHNPTSALFGATLFGELREIFQMIPAPGSNQSWDLIDFLAQTVAQIRMVGWVPASLREAGKAPTVDAVTEGRAPVASEEDELKAAKVAAWAKGLNRGSNDYLNNVRAVATDGYVTLKTAGVTASMVAAYDRDHEVKPSSTSEFVGKVGDRGNYEVTLVGMSAFHGYYGNGMVYRFLSGQNEMVWFASGEGLGDKVKCGDNLTVKGTVKKHEVRNGRKQTVLNRVTLA